MKTLPAAEPHLNEAQAEAVFGQAGQAWLLAGDTAKAHALFQRLATIAHGDGVCTTHVPTPSTKKVTHP